MAGWTNGSTLKKNRRSERKDCNHILLLAAAQQRDEERKKYLNAKAAKEAASLKKKRKLLRDQKLEEESRQKESHEKQTQATLRKTALFLDGQNNVLETIEGLSLGEIPEAISLGRDIPQCERILFLTKRELLARAKAAEIDQRIAPSLPSSKGPTIKLVTQGPPGTN